MMPEPKVNDRLSHAQCSTTPKSPGFSINGKKVFGLVSRIEQLLILTNETVELCRKPEKVKFDMKIFVNNFYKKLLAVVDESICTFSPYTLGDIELRNQKGEPAKIPTLQFLSTLMADAQDVKTDKIDIGVKSPEQEVSTVTNSADAQKPPTIVRRKEITSDRPAFCQKKSSPTVKSLLEELDSKQTPGKNRYTNEFMILHPREENSPPVLAPGHKPAPLKRIAPRAESLCLPPAQRQVPHHQLTSVNPPGISSLVPPNTAPPLPYPYNPSTTIEGNQMRTNVHQFAHMLDAPRSATSLPSSSGEPSPAKRRHVEGENLPENLTHFPPAEMHRLGAVFPCRLCKAKFRNKSSLRRHMLIHTGEKPYECQVCGLKYTYSKPLNDHCESTGHFGNKCELCGMGFTKRSDLKAHTKAHVK